LAAAIEIGIWLKYREELVTKKQLEEKVLSLYPDIPKITIKDRIWKAIPDRFKNQGGAATQIIKK